jgi:predicted MFS family arabinose efflux permease
VALGAPLGGLIAGVLGWRGTYVFIALLGLIAAGAIFAMLPASLRGEKRSLRERLAVLTLPGVVPALLTTMFAVAGPFTVFIYVAPLASRGAGLDLAWLPAVTLAFGIGAAIGNTLGGQLGDRIGATFTATGSVVLGTVALVLLSVVPHLPEALRAPALIGLMVPWGIVGWAFLPAQVSRLVTMVGAAAPLVLALNGSALYLGTALGAVTGAQVLEHADVADLGWIAAIYGVISLVLISYRPVPAPLPRLG